jgi:hypothetical protein
MFVKPSDAKKRRFRRRIKAAASIAVALCAGTFLACQRGVQTIQNVIDASSEKDADGDSNSPQPLSPTDASNSTAMVLVADAGKDAEARARKLKDAAVDVNEHRKGMPVPDNLLE